MDKLEMNAELFIDRSLSCSQIKSRLRFRPIKRKNELLDLLDLFDSNYYAWR